MALRLYRLKQVYLDGTVVRTNDYTAAIPTEPLTGEEYILPADVDEILPSLPLFRENVLAMIDQARQLGVTPVFLTQPLLFDDSPAWRGIAARTFWVRAERFNLSAASYARLLDRFNEELRSLCAAKGVTCFDLAAQIPHADECFYDLAHFNDGGADLAGRRVADFLHSRVLRSDVVAGAP